MVSCNKSNIWFLFVLNRLTGWQGAAGRHAHRHAPHGLRGERQPDVPGRHGYAGVRPPAEALRRDGRVRGRGSDTRNGLRARNRVHLVLPPGEHHERHAGDGVHLQRRWRAREDGEPFGEREHHRPLLSRRSVRADTRTNTECLYLGGDAYSAPAVYVRQGNTWQVYYIIRDYLGSICAITNSGGLVAEYSYDPWGNLRDPETLEAYAPGEEPELFLGRGFTGHEHLTAYGLINMNARLYDPMTGRFLSPDPYVQAPDFSQAFNRFSYCWNNPMRYVDEDGEWIHILIGAIIGGIANLVSNWKQADNFWEGLGYFAAGAAVGSRFCCLGWLDGWSGQGSRNYHRWSDRWGDRSCEWCGHERCTQRFKQRDRRPELLEQLETECYHWCYQRCHIGSYWRCKERFSTGQGRRKKHWWGNEVKYGRTQWSFFTSEKPYAVVKWDIENVGSLNENDCVPTSFAEANEYFRGGQKL